MFDSKEYAREYARKQREQRRKDGACLSCGNKSDAKKTCSECLAKKKRSQKRLERGAIEAGLCVRCRKVPPTGGTMRCDGCREVAKSHAKKSTAKKKSLGNCLSCGAPGARGVRCDECRIKSGIAGKNLRARRREEGVCRDCGKAAQMKDVTERRLSYYCHECYVKVMARGYLGSARHWKVLIEKLDACDWRCPYTGEKLVFGENLSFDHMDPISRFPEKKYDPDNIEPISLVVNMAKRQLTKGEFSELVLKIALHLNKGRSGE